MSCCGSKRQSFLPETSDNSAASAVSEAIVYVKFRYTGQRSMVVTGGMTGARYRFPAPGAEAMVDHRDAPGMVAVPNMARVANPE